MMNVYDEDDSDERKVALDNGYFYLTNGNDQLLIYAYAVTFGEELFENLYE